MAVKALSLSSRRTHSHKTVDVTVSDFECPFCHCVVNKPVELPCKAVICMDCILWLLRSGSISNCPSCNEVHDPLLISPVSLLFIKLLLKLVIECTCSKTVLLENLTAHIESGCKVSIIDKQEK